MIHAEAPRWAGQALPDMPFEMLARHAVDFWLCGEDLPRAGEPGDARQGRRRSTSSIDEKNNVEGVKRLRHKLDGMLGTSACASTTCSTTASTCTSRCRSARRPTRPGPCGSGPTRLDSALDTNCRAHDVDNLYVVDTSFFPSIGAVNPSLTAMANALRVGDHLLERLGRGG